jgi:imidazolonepropionase-like amidohydrolase
MVSPYRGELPGCFAIPGGLVDAHAHLTLDFGGVVGLDQGSPELVAANLARQARAGVLWVRDAGAVDGARVRGPGVVSCGRFLAPRGRYFPELSAGVDDLVDAALEQDTPWVKVIADFPGHDMNWVAAPPNYDLGQLTELVDAAHAAGKRVAAHVSTALAAECVAAGVDSLEHAPLLDPESLDALGERGGAWTPTLRTVAGNLEAIPPAAPLLDALRANLARAVAAGVRVMAGCDDAGHGAIAAEVAYMVKYGMDPADAVAAASSEAREYLGLPDDGIVTYDADPRVDVGVLAQPAAVVDAAGRRAL